METFETLLYVLCGAAMPAALIVCAPRRARSLRAFGSERGSMLIEVMVGALILAITTTAVLNGVDGAQRTGGRNKARTVAAALAEQDQERMHSMPVTDLLPYVTTPYVRTVNVKGATYTVTSTASYATDAGAVTVGCSATAKTQANLRILSSVSSPLTRGTVDQVGLVTPPAGSGYNAGQGRIIVKVVDRSQAAIQGVSVDLSGTASFSESTNAAGCAIFPFAPAGNYTAAISRLGLVGWDGESPVSKAVSSTAGQTTTYGPYELDQPATINAQFDTVVGGTTASVSPTSRWITVNNSKLSLQREVFDAGSPSTTVTAGSLFPFLDGYGIYAGQCPSNAPGTLPNTAPAPGATVTTSPKIRMPSINVRVVSSTSTTSPGPAGTSGANVVVKTTDGTCSNTFPNQTSGSVTYGATTYTGAIPKPGFPYGSYTVCAEQTVSGAVRHAFADLPPYNTVTPNTVNETVNNNTAAGNTTAWNTAGGLIRIYLSTTATPAAGQAGGCP